jgi:hypothetical protein
MTLDWFVEVLALGVVVLLMTLGVFELVSIYTYVSSGNLVVCNLLACSPENVQRVTVAETRSQNCYMNGEEVPC